MMIIKFNLKYSTITLKMVPGEPSLVVNELIESIRFEDQTEMKVKLELIQDGAKVSLHAEDESWMWSLNLEM